MTRDLAWRTAVDNGPAQPILRGAESGAAKTALGFYGVGVFLSAVTLNPAPVIFVLTYGGVAAVSGATLGAAFGFFKGGGMDGARQRMRAREAANGSQPARR